MVIIGGGVIGLGIARALAQRGVREVTVIERDDFGCEASWAAGGILAPQVEADAADDFFRLAHASRELYPDLAKELHSESGVDIELDTTGTLYVAFTEEQEDELCLRYRWQQNEGLAVEWLTHDQVRALEPCLSRDVRCALRFPRDFQVENRRLVTALLHSTRKLGVSLIDHCAVKQVSVAAGRVRGVETSQGFMGSQHVVLAAGAWSSVLDPSRRSQVEPIRGQMLCFRSEPQIARHVIYGARGYLIPRRDGRLLAGSTNEQAGFDKRVTEEGVESIKAMALELAPQIATLSLIDKWAGFRPRAQDDLPVLGMSAEIEGLSLATGHYRNGILLAPITGKLMAEAIVSGKVPDLMAPFSPERFRAAVSSA
ncbi:MAG TPA: glycine oxidase ThiO [Pyrinomonadaceae bacterium]|nr:glycine oxidase ThiO [Pyrinomonadaceae bacterium]